MQRSRGASGGTSSDGSPRHSPRRSPSQAVPQQPVPKDEQICSAEKHSDEASQASSRKRAAIPRRGRASKEMHLSVSVAPVSGKERRRIREENLKKRRQLCRFFASGSCARGLECIWAHGEDELVVEPPERPVLWKVKLCQHFISGWCAQGHKCPFAHGQNELQAKVRGGRNTRERLQEKEKEYHSDNRSRSRHWNGASEGPTWASAWRNSDDDRYFEGNGGDSWRWQGWHERPHLEPRSRSRAARSRSRGVTLHERVGRMGQRQTSLPSSDRGGEGRRLWLQEKLKAHEISKKTSPGAARNSADQKLDARVHKPTAASSKRQVSREAIGRRQAAVEVKPLLVSGCTHERIADGIHGLYRHWGSHHGRPAFRSACELTKGFAAFIYYWDSRDGADFCGWWMGPRLGGEDVWVRHSDHHAKTPPVSGWRVPHDGAEDRDLSVREASAEELVKAEMAKKKSGSDEVLPLKDDEDDVDMKLHEVEKKCETLTDRSPVVDFEELEQRLKLVRETGIADAQYLLQFQERIQKRREMEDRILQKMKELVVMESGALLKEEHHAHEGGNADRKDEKDGKEEMETTVAAELSLSSPQKTEAAVDKAALPEETSIEELEDVKQS